MYCSDADHAPSRRPNESYESMRAGERKSTVESPVYIPQEADPGGPQQPRSEASSTTGSTNHLIGVIVTGPVAKINVWSYFLLCFL